MRQGQAPATALAGSISVAADEERWEEILRGASMATTFDVETEVIDLDRAKEMWPLLNTTTWSVRCTSPKMAKPHRSTPPWRWQREPKRAVPSIIEGVAVDELVADEWQGRRRRDRAGLHRGRDRCARQRHVDPPTRGDDRRQRATSGVRALLHRHGAPRWRRSRDADPA